MPTAPTLEYAVVDEAADCRRRVRSAIALAACVLGGLQLAVDGWTAMNIAGVIPTDTHYGWADLFRIENIIENVAAVALLTAGIALIRGWQGALWIIRGATLSQVLARLGSAIFNVAIHAGMLPSQPALRWQDCVWDALSRMTWVLSAPAVLFLFAFTLRARDRTTR